MLFDLPKCPRCGDSHAGVKFVAFKRHAGDPSPTHWATCPTTGEPIQVRLGGERLADGNPELVPASVWLHLLAHLERGEIDKARDFLRKMAS